MKVGEIKNVLKRTRNAGVPIFLWGPPGVGKSAAVFQAAQELKIGFVDLRLSLLNPVDLRGIPVPDRETGITRWLPPSFLPQNGEGILFLDELNVAPPATQAAAYQLILDRRCGEYVMPPGWYIVAAGNRGTDRALVYEMPSPLRNRMLHFDVEVSIKDWMDWAWKNNVDSRVIAFLNFKNDALFEFDPKVHTKAFPSPRSWEFVSRIISQGEVTQEMVTGAVGEGMAHVFMTFLKVASKLPSVKDILMGKKVEVPSELSAKFALCGAVVGELVRIESPAKHMEAARNMIKFALDSLPSEFAVLLVKDYSRTPAFKKVGMKFFETPEWVEYAAKYGDLVTG